MAIQEQEVRDLVDLHPDEFLVTSFYLNVDAQELPSEDQVLTSFDSLIHAAESERKQIEENLSHESKESIRGDLEKIRDFIHNNLDRQNTRGLAIFSCSGEDVWEVVNMPNKVANHVSFAPLAYLTPLATFLSHSKPTAILLTDREHARIFTMARGEAREWTDFEDYVPTRSQAGGWSQMRFQRRSDHWAKHHIDRAAELVLDLLKHQSFDWLILGTEPEAQSDLIKGLHPYLLDRLIGQIHVRIDAPMEEVIEQARVLREQVEEQHIDDLMHRVQEYAGAGGRGSIGLGDTLKALNEQKIHILLCQEGFSHAGSVCAACGMIFTEDLSTCPACGGEARHADNVVDAAIQKAMELDSTVEIATGYNKLEPIKCIGSILYY